MEGDARPAQELGDLFFDAFRASPIGIAIEDLNGQPVFVNPALCSMLGFSEEDMRRKHCVDFSPPEDAQRDWELFQQLRAGAIDHYSLDKRYFRRDGSFMWGRLSISLLNDRPSPLVIAMVEDITDKRQVLDALQQSEANLQKLSGRLIEAQDDERRHLAREIHDDIGQKLALVVYRLQQIAGRPASTEREHEIEPVLADIADVSHALHALSHRLHSSRLDTLGLVPTMDGFCREAAKQYGVSVDFTHGQISNDLSRHVSLCLFRVLQEAVQNAIKHSGTRRVQVGLQRVSNAIELTIRDFGTGFDMSVAALNDGIGLMSMRERVHLVRGTVSIQSRQDGTEIRVHVPVADTASE